MVSIVTRVFVGMLLALLLATSFLGAVSAAKADMMMGMDGRVSSSHCFVPGMTEMLCHMNPLEHIAAWQGMFTAVQNSSTVFTLLLALLALVLGSAIPRLFQGAAPPRAIAREASIAYRKRGASIISPLQEALARGILHPKVF